MDVPIDVTKLTPLTGSRNDVIRKTIDGYMETTPNHADYFNRTLQQLIDNDVTLEGDTLQAIKDLRINQLNLALELETIKGSNASGVSSNIFVESFTNTNDVISLNGALKFDETNDKIYLA
ncbi:hypothetical protein [Exiguobacterium sp. s181]|uniref:hypothetical protein n=1 Tax=Exiguobacterium sp. s181 TaxID=2751288 RepID=UPI002035BD19|nr:hypothetical protein [Exiguobacterium sp. s181]